MQNTSYRDIILKALLGPKRVTTIGIWPDPLTQKTFRIGLATTIDEANALLSPDRQYTSICLVMVEAIPAQTFIIEYEDGSQDRFVEKVAPVPKQKYIVGTMANA